MLGDLDLKRIAVELGKLDFPLEIVLHPGPAGTALAEEFQEAVGQIEAQASDKLLVKTGDGKSLPAVPGISLSCRGKSNIHYLALPEGPEALPFIEACTSLPAGAAGRDKPWARQLSGLSRPAEIYVFMATTCPNCPHAVRAALELSRVSWQVTTFVIDAQRHAELAAEFNIKSVPTTIIDGGYSFVGIEPAERLVDLLLARDDDDFTARIFETLIETGQLDRAARRVLEGQTRGFLESWKNSNTTARMGLMLVVEQVLDDDPRAMDAMVGELTGLLESNDTSLRGDTADVLGQIGHPDAREGLRALLGDPNPDVAEIATEALESLEDSTS